MTKKADDAKADYLAGKSYKEIAKKYGVSAGTVRAWKSRYRWDDPPPKKSVTKSATQHKNVATKRNSVATDDEANLTPQQELFAQLVGGKRIPLYRAYQIAYEKPKSSSAAAMTAASRLAHTPKVSVRIVKISEAVASEYHWSTSSVIDELTFVHDESKADMIANGVKKANADAMLQSVNSITDVLGLKAADREQIRRLKADADMAEFETKLRTHPESIEDRTVIVDDFDSEETED